MNKEENEENTRRAKSEVSEPQRYEGKVLFICPELGTIEVLVSLEGKQLEVVPHVNLRREMKSEESSPIFAMFGGMMEKIRSEAP